MKTDTKILIGFMSFIMLIFASLIYAQVAGIPSFPPTFSYTLPQLPPSLSPNQIIFTNCPYIHPIELKSVQVYDVNGSQLSPLITAQIQIYTNGRRSVCSFKKSFLVQPSLNSAGLVSNFAIALNNEITNQINANTQPFSTPPPISTNS